MISIIFHAHSLTETPFKNMGGFEACPGLHIEFDKWTKKRLPNPVQQNKRNLKQKVRSKICNEKRNSEDGDFSLSLDPNLHKLVKNKNAFTSQKDKNEEETDTDSVINGGIVVEPVVSTDSDPESHKWKHPPCVGQFTPIRMIEDSDIINRFEHIPCSAGDLVLWDYRIPHSNSYKNTSDTPREAIYLGFLPNVMINKEYIKDQLIRFHEGIVPCDQWHSHNQPQVCNYSFSSLGRKLMGMESWG